MKIKGFKKYLIGFVSGLVLAGGVVTAANSISGVYYNPFDIILNGSEYIPQLPILNFSSRTYVPLRELATLTGNEVDFVDNKIIINNNDNDVNNDNIFGKWIPQYAIDKNGKELDLHLVYGSGIMNGGSLELFDNGRYTNYVGIMPDNAEQIYSGNFNVKGNNIILTNKNNTQQVIRISKDKEGKRCIIITDRDCDVYYYQVERKYIDILKVEKSGNDFLVTVQEYERYKLDSKQIADVKSEKEVVLPDGEGNMVKLKFSYDSNIEEWVAELYNENAKMNLRYVVDKNGYLDNIDIQSGEIYAIIGKEKQYVYHDNKIYWGVDGSTNISGYIGNKNDVKANKIIGDLYYLELLNGEGIKIGELL